LNVARTYLSLQGVDGLLAAAHDAEKVAVRREEDAKAQISAGTAVEINLLRAQSDTAAARAQIASLTGQRESLLQLLETLVGEPVAQLPPRQGGDVALGRPTDEGTRPGQVELAGRARQSPRLAGGPRAGRGAVAGGQAGAGADRCVRARGRGDLAGPAGGRPEPVPGAERRGAGASERRHPPGRGRGCRGPVVQRSVEVIPARTARRERVPDSSSPGGWRPVRRAAASGVPLDLARFAGQQRRQLDGDRRPGVAGPE